MEYSGLLKQYVINRGTYVDKKMEPLATKSDLDNFNEMWMFPGLRVTVLEDEDGLMRDYRCKMVDGEKVWVREENVTQEKLDEVVSKIESDAAELDERLDAIEDMMIIQGSDIE